MNTNEHVQVSSEVILGGPLVPMGHQALLGVARWQGEVSCTPMLHSGRPASTLPLLAAQPPPLHAVNLAADCCCGRRSGDLDLLWLATHRGACKPLWLLWPEINLSFLGNQPLQLV